MLRGKIKTSGPHLSYKSIGSGSHIILIHGLATNHAFWRINVLMQLARDHRVTVYDQRGHGNSDMPASGYTTAALADDLHDLFENLGIERAHLVGHSLGGVVALQYAALHPERVQSMVVADSRVRSLQPTNYLSDWPRWEKARERLRQRGINVPEDEVESGLWLLELLASPEWAANREKLDGCSLGVPFGGWNGGQKTARRWLELMQTTSARTDFVSGCGLGEKDLTSIRSPVLAMYGENSATLPSLSGLSRCLPDCEVVLVPGASHFFPLTQAEYFVQEVKRFLLKTEQPS